MNFEDVQTLWRSQDARPPFSLDEYVLRHILEQQRKDLSRIFLWELAAIYGSALLMVMIGAIMPVAMYFKHDMRTALDFALAICLIAAPLIWAIAAHVSYMRRKRLEPSFTLPVREAIERDLQRIDYEISRRTPFTHVLMTQAVPLISSVLIVMVTLRINKMALPIWMAPYLMLTIVGSLIWGVRSTRRTLEREFHPRRHELQALRDKLS